MGGAAGQFTSASLGNGTYSLSYSLSASYDNALRFTTLMLTTVSLATMVFGTQRGYDPVGNVTSVTTTLAAGTDNQAFCYDSLNRLVWAGSTGTPNCSRTLTPGTLTAANYTATYAYDATNRITSGSLGTLSYGDSNHFHGATASTTGETASYDPNGDMQCRVPTSATTCAGGTPTGARLDYDAERRLTQWQNAQSNPTSQAWYLYDGSGQRVEQYVSGGSGNHTYYLPGGVEEVTPSGSLIKYYAAGGMTLGLNTARDASGISYLASDGLGSVSEALSPSGSATGAQLYSPYDGVRYTSGTMPTSKGFTGQYSDAASSGLDYYRARYYDPQLGQFTSADTVNDGFNRYGYVKGNPETATDPTGHRMNCDTGYCDKPPPSGDGGGGGGDCTSDATRGCYKSCGGGNGTGDKCEGNKACSPAKPPRCRPVCETGTHQEGGLLSLSGYDTSQLTVVGVDGIDFLVGLLEDLLGSIQTRAQAVGGRIDAIIAFLAAISAVAPPLIPLIAGVAAANTVAFTVLYMRAEDNVHHIIAYLKAVKGVVSDNPELRDTIVVNLVEKRLPDPPINLPLSGQNNLRALGVDWGTLYVSSPQITGASGLWPPMP